MNERLPYLIKQLRKEASAVKLKKLMALDRSDRMLMERELERIINDLIRVQAVGEAQCTVVLEMFETMGGTIRTVRTP